MKQQRSCAAMQTVSLQEHSPRAATPKSSWVPNGYLERSPHAPFVRQTHGENLQISGPVTSHSWGLNEVVKSTFIAGTGRRCPCRPSRSAPASLPRAPRWCHAVRLAEVPAPPPGPIRDSLRPHRLKEMARGESAERERETESAKGTGTPSGSFHISWIHSSWICRKSASERSRPGEELSRLLVSSGSMKYSISICSNSRDRKRNCLLRGRAADVPLQRGQLRRPWSDLVAESLAESERCRREPSGASRRSP